MPRMASCALRDSRLKRSVVYELTDRDALDDWVPLADGDLNILPQSQ
jgi:hypothetical protein